MEGKIIELLKSSRFWAIVISLFALVVNQLTGKQVDETTLNQMVILILGFIGVRTATDIAKINKS
jgi:hypothetical protein